MLKKIGFLPALPSFQLGLLVCLSHKAMYQETPEKGGSKCCAILPSGPTQLLSKQMPKQKGEKKSKFKFELHTIVPGIPS